LYETRRGLAACEQDALVPAASSTSPATRRRIIIAHVTAIAVVAASAAAAAFIPAPASVPAVALKSVWAFRGIVFVACPVGMAIVWSIVASILDGRPLADLGFVRFGPERHPSEARSALAAGGTALEAARRATPATTDDRACQEAMGRFRASLANLEAMAGEPR
jgi:hypothetical protein